MRFLPPVAVLTGRYYRYVPFMGKNMEDNHLLKDTVICDDSEDTRTHKIFRGLEVSVMKWIWETQSGWNLQSDILRNMEKPDFIRIIL